jgi:hypothetical protein
VGVVKGRKLPAVTIVNHGVGLEIDLIPNDIEWQARRYDIDEDIVPVSKRMERFTFCHIIHKESGTSTAEVQGDKRTIDLVAGRVPHLKENFLVINGNADLRAQATDSRSLCGRWNAEHLAGKDRRFANA